MPQLAVQIEKIHGFIKVNYGKVVVEQLFSTARWVRVVSVVFIVLLALGAVFLIATTIRLAIFARRKEIYLMKLIGSTDWFIRWPFFIEGVGLGALGSLVSIIILAVAYGSLLKRVDTILFNASDQWIRCFNPLIFIFVRSGSGIGDYRHRYLHQSLPGRIKKTLSKLKE